MSTRPPVHRSIYMIFPNESKGLALKDPGLPIGTLDETSWMFSSVRVPEQVDARRLRFSLSHGAVRIQLCAG